VAPIGPSVQTATSFLQTNQALLRRSRGRFRVGGRVRGEKKSDFVGGGSGATVETQKNGGGAKKERRWGNKRKWEKWEKRGKREKREKRGKRKAGRGVGRRGLVTVARGERQSARVQPLVGVGKEMGSIEGEGRKGKRGRRRGRRRRRRGRRRGRRRVAKGTKKDTTTDATDARNKDMRLEVCVVFGQSNFSCCLRCQTIDVRRVSNLLDQRMVGGAVQQRSGFLLLLLFLPFLLFLFFLVFLFFLFFFLSFRGGESSGG